jgi:hypothetical protein
VTGFALLHHDPAGVLAHAHRVLCDVRKHWHLPRYTVGFYFTIAKGCGRHAVDWSWFAIRRSA